MVSGPCRNPVAPFLEQVKPLIPDQYWTKFQQFVITNELDSDLEDFMIRTPEANDALEIATYDDSTTTTFRELASQKNGTPIKGPELTTKAGRKLARKLCLIE